MNPHAHDSKWQGCSGTLCCQTRSTKRSPDECQTEEQISTEQITMRRPHHVPSSAVPQFNAPELQRAAMTTTCTLRSFDPRCTRRASDRIIYHTVCARVLYLVAHPQTIHL